MASSSISIPRLQDLNAVSSNSNVNNVSVGLGQGRPNNETAPQRSSAKGWVHFVAGGMGGMCGAIITSPLDVVKTRLQSDLFRPNSAAATATKLTQRNPGVFANIRHLAYHFVETGQLLRDIGVKEGPRGLFKGLGPTLVGVIPARSINFYTYGNGKRVLADKLNGGVETPLIHLSAAAMAGVTTATATNPIWVVKTRLQLDSNQAQHTATAKAKPTTASLSTNKPMTVSALSASKSSIARFSTSAKWHDIKPSKSLGLVGNPALPQSRVGMSALQTLLHIIKSEGIRGLYKGMSASYLGVAEGTIQWVLYEKLKKLGHHPSNDGSSNSSSKLSSMVGAAGTAKFTASLITYPHEVIRTRLRQQPQAGQPRKYTGLVQTIKLIVKEEGAAALYSGLSAHLLRVVPNAVVMFSIYELTLRLASQKKANGEW